MKSKIQFTAQETQNMYTILLDIKQTLNEVIKKDGLDNMPMYQLSWLLVIEECLGRIEVDRLLNNPAQ